MKDKKKEPKILCPVCDCNLIEYYFFLKQFIPNTQGIEIIYECPDCGYVYEDKVKLTTTRKEIEK